jgi:nitroreductase / dihydropteridine reductase
MRKVMTTLIEKLNWRYATKKMAAGEVVPQEAVERILEAANLAPTSSGLQPFEIIVVTNAAVKARLSAAAFGQQQLMDGSHVLVFAAWDNYTAERIDAVVAQTHAERGTPVERLNSYYDGLKAQYLPREAEVNFQHAARQAYIAFGVALTAAAFEAVDATPMEGFDPAQVDEILGLRAKGLRSVTLMPLGYRAQEGDWLNGAKKVRKPLDALVTRID